LAPSRKKISAAALAPLLTLLALLVSCSADEPEGTRDATLHNAATNRETADRELTSREGAVGSGDTTSLDPTREETRSSRAVRPAEDARFTQDSLVAEARPESRSHLVPVAHLTSRRENVSLQGLSRHPELAVPKGYRADAERLLDRRVFDELGSAEEVVERVSRTPGALGLVPWDAVDPRVKALEVNGVSLLEPDGAGPEGYPLRVEGAGGPDPDQLRRIVAAGDVLLDRGVFYAAYHQGLGPDFPLEGGEAAVTYRAPLPDPDSETGRIHQFTARRIGGEGSVRSYLQGADLTLANLENPVLENAVWHYSGVTFNGDLRLLPVLQKAGIDGVTLGNNHILDAEPGGLEETTAHLRDADIQYAGAGPNLQAARRPMVFDLGGTRVGVLSYQGVPDYEWSWATETAPGTAPLKEEVVRRDVRRLREEVDVVVVQPHWGLEYTATPEPEQVELARAAVDAGADLVVGHHAHWAKGIEVYKGAPIFYGTGNFIFDQDWSEETSTGIFADITLYGDRIVQSSPVPFIILNKGQPNFLLPQAGGNRALQNVFSTSIGPEFEGN
jgi:poly-gamma-glutamate synthesis protein (capsule biosynthesis protein)